MILLLYKLLYTELLLSELKINDVDECVPPFITAPQVVNAESYDGINPGESTHAQSLICNTAAPSNGASPSIVIPVQLCAVSSGNSTPSTRKTTKAQYGQKTVVRPPRKQKMQTKTVQNIKGK